MDSPPTVSMSTATDPLTCRTNGTRVSNTCFLIVSRAFCTVLRKKQDPGILECVNGRRAYLFHAQLPESLDNKYLNRVTSK